MKKEEIKTEIELAEKNINVLKKAKKECDCDASNKLHYHELLHYDEESGDEYIEESEEKHNAFMERLANEIQELKSKL